jgi:hypothetical protein
MPMPHDRFGSTSTVARESRTRMWKKLRERLLISAVWLVCLALYLLLQAGAYTVTGLSKPPSLLIDGACSLLDSKPFAFVMGCWPTPPARRT